MIPTESGTVREVSPEEANAIGPIYSNPSGSSMDSRALVFSKARSSMLTKPLGRSTFSRLAQEENTQ